MKNFKVTIIIPAFNEEKSIEKCLKTLLDQSYKNTEIIVVDDGSSDKTTEIVKNFPVTFLSQEHKGPAKARNFGAKSAKGEILVFMDADMSFSRDFIEDLVKPINAGEEKGTFSKEEYISNWDNAWSRCWNFNQNWPERKMIPDDYPDEGMDFRAILKEEFLRIGGFDDTGYTDTWTLAKKLGYKPKAVKGAKYFHANPDNLEEIFLQAKWVSKRPYKFGVIGEFVALIRNSFPVSIIVGVFKSIKYKEGNFLIFKVIYDLGTFFGLFEMMVTGKKIK